MGLLTPPSVLYYSYNTLVHALTITYSIPLIAMAIRRSLTGQGEVVRWVRVPPTNKAALVRASLVTPVLSLLLFLSLFKFFSFTPNWSSLINLLWHSFWVGNIRLCIVPCSQANNVTQELHIPLYCPPSHALFYLSA